MIPYILYALIFATATFILRKHIAFFIRLALCRHHTQIYYYQRGVDKISDKLNTELAEFVECLKHKGKPYNAFLKNLQDHKVYILTGKSFYYPMGAKYKGTRHYHLVGLYSKRFKWIILAENGNAWKWELKNCWNRTYWTGLQDPAPDEIGLGGCV